MEEAISEFKRIVNIKKTKEADLKRKEMM